MIPLTSPLAQYHKRKNDIQAAIERVLEGGTYVLGEEVERFERAFAEYSNVQHGVGVGSGTDALILALRAAEIGSGDEVITVSHTALPTVAAILAVGAVPVLVDVDPRYFTIDIAGLEAAITSRTKAVIPVHIYGQSVDMSEIMEVSKKHGLIVIEDCAQSTGGVAFGKRTGSWGHMSCFSFYPTKNLGAIGDGGMVLTDSPELAAKLRRIRQYGWDDNRNAVEPGLNSRLDSLQAAILGAKLEGLDVEIAQRNQFAEQYATALEDFPITLPVVRLNTVHAYHLFVIQTEHRDALKDHLAINDIVSAVHYPVPIHNQSGYKDLVRLPEEGLPVTDQLASRILSLPLYPEMLSQQVEYVCDTISEYFS